MHAYTKQFGGIAHVSGFESEWHENFDGFHKTTCGFLSNPKVVISRTVRFMCVQNTSSSDVHGRPTWETWAPQLECLGARRAPQNFYLGDQLWGLGALTKMLGSPKGSLKFSLEHSLGAWKLRGILNFTCPRRSKTEQKIFIYNATMTSNGHYLYESWQDMLEDQNCFFSCYCHVFRDIDETSTEEASLELDSPGWQRGKR